MSEEVTIETTGDTPGEAKWAAVRELERLIPGLDRDAVRFQVLTEGARGVLGVGYVPARVVASAPAPGPSEAVEENDPPGAPRDAAQEAVSRIVGVLDDRATIRVSETEDDVFVHVASAEPGLLIGRQGQMIDAMQYVANAIAARETDSPRRRVVVEVAGYRERRVAALEAQARAAADRALAEAVPQELEPMGAADRRAVHECLADDPRVETASSGDEPHRRVVVTPSSHGS